MSYRRKKRRKKSGLIDDTTKKYMLGALFVVALVLGGTTLQSVYVGGWSIQPSFNTLTLDSVEYAIDGLKSNVYDVDGDFVPKQFLLNDEIAGQSYAINKAKTGISVEIDDVYYLNTAGYPSEIAEIIKSYDVDVGKTELVRYNLYNLAYDITIKTDADKYDKPLGVYLDFGWFFENAVVEVTALTNFHINPWVVSGTADGWSADSGWAGILAASISDVSFGLVQSDADENYGHVIQNIHSVGANLNTYTKDEQNAVFDFENPDALIGVPSSVQIEVSAKLGAGADYTELLGHWTSVSVRNVFVKYRVLVEVATSVDYTFQLSPTGPMDDPDESNTNYAPTFSIPFLPDILDFLEGLPIVPILLVIVAIIISFIVIRRFLFRAAVRTVLR